MSVKVIDLAPHEWREMSSCTNLGALEARRKPGWKPHLVVAVISAGVGFYASTAKGDRAPTFGFEGAARLAPEMSAPAINTLGLRARLSGYTRRFVVSSAL